MIRALLRMALRKAPFGWIDTGVTVSGRGAESGLRRMMRFTGWPTLLAKEATGSNGLPSTPTISSPVRRSAAAPGSPSITPDTKVRPSISRVKMPMPG